MPGVDIVCWFQFQLLTEVTVWRTGRRRTGRACKPLLDELTREFVVTVDSDGIQGYDGTTPCHR